MCTYESVRSAWASTQSDQSSLWVANDRKLLQEASEDWSDLVDAPADLSLRWGHMHYLLVVSCYTSGVKFSELQYAHSV